MLQKTIFIKELNYHVTYQLTSQEKYIDDIGIIKVFGISVYKEYEEHSLYKRNCMHLNDISANQKFVEHILERLILHTVLPINLIEIIDELI